MADEGFVGFEEGAGGAPKRPSRSSRGFEETFLFDGGANKSADAELSPPPPVSPPPPS
jgi:hypothetical protein